ncbi:MAG: hypothetical protein JJT94_12790 [Bernardetiaceae bacterium]|nr:hypothetical protein [Bernardetiaceae bacterium]
MISTLKIHNLLYNMTSYPSIFAVFLICIFFCSLFISCTPPESEEQTLVKRNLELLDSIKNRKAQEKDYLNNLPSTSDIDTVYDMQNVALPAIPKR